MTVRIRAAAWALAAIVLASGSASAVTASAVTASAVTAPAMAAAAVASPTVGARGVSDGGGWQRVTFHGVSLAVPASWPVLNLASHPRACPRLDQHAVYLGLPGPAPHCPASRAGITETVQLQLAQAGSPAYRTATVPARRGGVSVLTNPDPTVSHSITDVVRKAGVQVTLTYRGDAALALRIQASMRLRPGMRAAGLPRPAPVRPVAPAGRRQGLFQGSGFDTCAAPAAGSMTQWLSSPYRAVGVYIGGVNRACAQHNLSNGWLSAIRAQGWSYFPFYVGLQSSCIRGTGNARINPGQAAAQGKAAADDAVLQAQALGIPAGSPLIYDMEAYAPSCDQEVTTFLGGWDAELHARGYQAGVYESFTNIGALIRAAGFITEPDVIHYADWDGVPTTTSPYMPANRWTNHQRLHQYRGGHSETYGGVSMLVDSDQLDVNLSAVSPPKQGNPHTGFRIAVALTANRTAELFARSGRNAIVTATQRAAGSLSFSAVQPAGRSPTGLASNPAVTAGADGRLALFAFTRSGQVAHAWQQPGAPAGWQWGAPLLAPGSGPAPRTDPAAVRLPGGATAVLVTTRGGVFLSRQRQPGSNTGWTAWVNLKGSCVTTPAAVRAGSGVQIACVTAAGTATANLWNGSRWTGWSDGSAGPSGLTGVPALMAGPGAQTQLFAATAAGGIEHAWRSGSRPWTWGPPLAGILSGTATMNLPAASAWPGRQTAVLALLAGGQPGFAVELGSASSGSFTSWAVAGGQPPGGSALGSPAAWTNATGTPGLAVLDRNARLAVSRYAGGGWSSWAELSGSSF
jgi:Domain of unknown function (DUF1906)